MPLSSQYPVRPLLYGIVLPVNTSPQAAVVFPGAVIVGNAAGATVIVLDTDASGLPHASVAVHVSVTTPPQLPAGTCALKVDTFEVPLSSQYPVRPLLYGIVLPVNTSPQAAVVFPGASSSVMPPEQLRYSLLIQMPVAFHMHPSLSMSPSPHRRNYPQVPVH